MQKEAIEKAGLKFIKSVEQLKLEEWFEHVTNPRSGD
jgi:hypothetical protein